jgi:hypothetical protein
MSSLHSLIDNLTAAGNLYGWRVDAILLGGLLWIFSASLAELRSAF